MAGQDNQRRLKVDINAQIPLLNVWEKANQLRAEDTSKYPHAVAAMWGAMFPEMKEDLIELLDKKIPELTGKQIRDFDKDGFDTSYDLLNCIKEQFPKKVGFDGTVQDVKAAEVLQNFILRIYSKWGILGGKRDMPVAELRLRRVQRESR